MNNGQQLPLTVGQLYAMIGQLTVENQMLRAQIAAATQAAPDDKVKVVKTATGVKRV